MAGVNGPIRALKRATEPSLGVEGSVYHDLYFEGSPGRNDMFARELIRVHNGTYTGATIKALGSRHSTMTVKVPFLYDQIGYWLLDLLGRPVTTTLSGSTAFRHRFPFPVPVASGASGFSSGSFEAYNNVRWVKMLGGRAVTGRFNISATEHGTLDLTYLTQAATPIVDQPINDEGSDWDAAGSRALECSIQGTVVDLIKGSLEFDNKLVPFFTSRRTANLKRGKRNGLADLKFDGTFDWVDYVDSVKESFDNEEDVGLFVAEYMDTAHQLGSGVWHPRMAIVAENIIVETTDEPDDQGESANHAVGQSSYVNSASLTGYVEIDNNVPNYNAGT
jgi:hypothetical protein